MLKEVDCLPMVKPDAASHSEIRHVYGHAFQVSSDVGSLHRRWVTLCEKQRGSHLGRARMGNEVMPFVGSTV
jgi:hypothetical protein